MDLFYPFVLKIDTIKNWDEIRNKNSIKQFIWNKKYILRVNKTLFNGEMFKNGLGRNQICVKIILLLGIASFKIWHDLIRFY